LAFSLNAFSQIEKPITKGNIMLSGGGSISQVKNSYSTGFSNTSSINCALTPGFSYFILDNFAIGLNTNLEYSGLINSKTYTLGIGPKVKYYFNNGLFVNAEVSYNSLHGISNNSYKGNFLAFKPGIGYAIFLNQKVSLEPGIFYEVINGKYHVSYGPADYKTSTLSLDIHLNVFF
jgi:hypothetical protein